MQALLQKPLYAVRDHRNWAVCIFSPLAHSLINYMCWEMLRYYDLSPRCITSEVKFPTNISHQFTLTGNYPSYMEERHLNSLAFSALRVQESEIHQTDDIDFLLWNSHKHYTVWRFICSCIVFLYSWQYVKQLTIQHLIACAHGWAGCPIVLCNL